jgi:hypothetical protein
MMLINRWLPEGLPSILTVLHNAAYIHHAGTLTILYTLTIYCSTFTIEYIHSPYTLHLTPYNYTHHTPHTINTRQTPLILTIQSQQNTIHAVFSTRYLASVFPRSTTSATVFEGSSTTPWLADITPSTDVSPCNDPIPVRIHYIRVMRRSAISVL